MQSTAADGHDITRARDFTYSDNAFILLREAFTNNNLLGLCVGPRRSLCRTPPFSRCLCRASALYRSCRSPTLSVWGPKLCRVSLSVSGPRGLVGLRRRSLCRATALSVSGARRSLCQAPALSVSGPLSVSDSGDFCVGPQRSPCLRVRRGSWVARWMGEPGLGLAGQIGGRSACHPSGRARYPKPYHDQRKPEK